MGMWGCGDMGIRMVRSGGPARKPGCGLPATVNSNSNSSLELKKGVLRLAQSTF